MDITIRAEGRADIEPIATVVEAAFGSPWEAELVAAIRASENFVPDWSLVAEKQGVIVGHVMVSFVGLVDGDTARRVATLSPLAVAPDQQGKGIGGALVRAVAERVDAAGEPLLVLEGNPVYYARFGFESAADHGITMTLPTWAPPEAAQVLRLHASDPTMRGHVVYPPAFADH